MIPIVSVDLMRASDAYTIENFTSDAILMEKAGKGISLICTYPGPYAIICGPGNNGGDGYVCARYLAMRNEDVTVFFTKEPTSESAKHHHALLEKYPAVTVKPYSGEEDLTRFNVIVDCLLGTGFSGEAHGAIARAIAAINDARSKGSIVISADINSGINGDTGKGNLAVISDITASIGFLKQGMMEESMSKVTKKIVNIDIGIQLVKEPSSQLHESWLPTWIEPEPIVV